MVLGDLGRRRVEHLIDGRMLNYWFRIVCSDKYKLSNIFYKLLYNLSVKGVYQAEWIKAIKCRLLKYDLYELWERQLNLSIDEFSIFKSKCKSKIQ